MQLMVRVWDAPTRLFHWALLVCFVSSVVSGQLGGDAMVWHFRFGYCVLTLLLFRLIWGFQGGYWSRFATFFYSPGQILAYLKGHGEPAQQVGHNPLGALSVFAMLLFLTLQVGTGLMSDDEIAAAGPLARLVSSAWVSQASFYHKEVGKLVLLLLVVSHLGAIAFYYFRQHNNLLRPMLTGDKMLPFPAQAASDSAADRTRAGILLLACAALVAGVISWLG